MNKRILKIRKSLNLTQRGFGLRLGVKDTAISRLESGERNLTEQMILSICREFNVNEEWLRTGQGGDEAIFDDYDDSNIASVISEYKLDSLSQEIIKSYVKIEPEQRAGLNEFISHLSDILTSSTLSTIKNGVVNEICNHTALSETTADSLIKRIQTVFDNAAPPAKLMDPPPKQSPRLHEMKNKANEQSVELDDELTPVDMNSIATWNNNLTLAEEIELVKQRHEDNKRGSRSTLISEKLKRNNA